MTKNILRSLRALVAAAHILSPLGLQPALALTPGVKLPPPAVSRALDAILLPIDAEVAREFKLSDRSGLLVLAVQPGGVADKQGVRPGDVLFEVGGRRVRKPIDVDVAVRRGLKGGKTNYSFDVRRDGAVVVVAAVITLALYEEVFSVSRISSWESWTYSEWSYSEFVSEYSEVIETSYESEEATVEQELMSEETATEEEATEEASTDESSEDADDDGMSATDDADDAASDASDSSDGTDDAATDDSDDSGGDSTDEAGDDAGADDAADSDAAEDDGGAEGEDSGDDDSGGDDSGSDDSRGDE